MNYHARQAVVKNGSVFESGGSRYLVQTAEKSWSFAPASNVDRFEVRGGDAWLNESPTNPTNRAELRCLDTLPFGADVWLSYDLMVEEGEPLTGWALFGQFHASPDSGEPGLPPVWALEAGEGFIQVRTRSSASSSTVAHETSQVHYKAPYVRGQWARLVFRLRFERGTEGHMQMWRDGAEVFNGPVLMGYNDALGPYWKYGIYRQAGPQTAVARYVGVRVSSIPVPIT